MIIIYHSADLDGYASGAICKRKYPDAKLIGYDYYKELPWDEIPAGEPVIMVDVSVPMDVMHKLAVHSGNFTWIDHHKSAIEEFSNYNWTAIAKSFVTPVLQVGIAACEIAWNYLFPLSEGHEIPAVVKLLGMYDTWRQNDTFSWDKEILPFQYGMRMRVKDADTFPQYLLNVGLGFTKLARVSESLERIIDTGDDILEYQRQQFEIAMHRAIEGPFQGLYAIACNLNGAGSLAYESVLKPEHQIMVGFGYTGSKWSFSLRTDKEDVDVSTIAKQFGGGGHAKAAGFAVDKLEEVINLSDFKRVMS